jgi:hypothetical protein
MGCAGQHRQGIGVGELGAEGRQSCRVELAQLVAQPVGVQLPRSDQGLMRAGQNLDGFG